jgi:hypothetical protein
VHVHTTSRNVCSRSAKRCPRHAPWYKFPLQQLTSVLDHGEKRFRRYILVVSRFLRDAIEHLQFRSLVPIPLLTLASTAVTTLTTTGSTHGGVGGKHGHHRQVAAPITCTCSRRAAVEGRLVPLAPVHVPADGSRCEMRQRGRGSRSRRGGATTSFTASS